MRTPAAAAARRRKTRQAGGTARQQVAPSPSSSEAAQRIATWAPQGQPARGCWSRIAATVRAIVLASDPGGPDIATKHMRAVARHVATEFTAGHRIDDWAELLSDPALTRTFGSSVDTDLADQTLGTELSFVRRVRVKAVPAAYGPVRELRKPGHQVSAAYSDAEVDGLLTWLALEDDPRYDPARSALVLGLGAGIDGYEADRVSGLDVLRTQWGVVVRAPGARTGKARPPRLVPVLARFERQLADLAVSAGANPLVGIRDNGKTRKLHEADHGRVDVPRIKGGPARSWWTRQLIVENVSFLGLRQAGVSVAADKALNLLAGDLRLPFDAFVTTLRCSPAPFDRSSFPGLASWDGFYAWPLR